MKTESILSTAGPGNTNIRLRRWLALLTLAVITLFYLFGNEKEPAQTVKLSSRHQTFSKILETSAEGYFFQVDRLIPTEAQWEDPGMGYLLGAAGMVSFELGFDPVSPRAIYIIQFIIFLLVFLLPFWQRIFQLPNWYYPVPALFILAGFSAPFPLLFWSFNLYWASSLGAFWVITFLLQILVWYVSPEKPRARSVLISCLVFGIVLGVIGSFRREVLSIGLAITFSFGFLLWLFSCIRQRSVKACSVRTIIAAALAGVLIFLGANAFNGLMQVTWAVRDRCYVLQDVPRNPTHPMWHPLYVGLGYVPNRFGIKWDDGVGWKHVEREFPGVRYGSQEHEQAARTLFFRTITQAPLLLLRNMLAKAVMVARLNWVPIALLGACAVLMIVRSAPLLAGLGLYYCACTLLLPLLTYPHPYYYLSFLSGIYLLFLIGFSSLAWQVKQKEGVQKYFFIFFVLAILSFAMTCIPGPPKKIFLPWAACLLTATGLYIIMTFIDRKVFLRLIVRVLLPAVLFVGLVFGGSYTAYLSKRPQFETDGKAEVRWTTKSKPDYVDINKIGFPVSINDAFQKYEITLPESDALTGIRLDIDSEDMFNLQIQSITLKDAQNRTIIIYDVGLKDLLSRWHCNQLEPDDTDPKDRYYKKTGTDPFLYILLPDINARQVAITMRLRAYQGFMSWLIDTLENLS